VNKKWKYIIGIDEAGRGPLAGPVYAGVVALPRDYKQLFKRTNAPQKLADSKKLTARQREEWFAWMKNHTIPYAYAFVSAKQVDVINIARASDRAAQGAYNKMKGKRVKGKVRVIADGGLTVSVPKNVSFKCYPKADELVPAVSLASIVAKVMRDRYMTRLDKKYPHYGFAVHKGYGTKKHYIALRKQGISPVHRLTFLGSLHTMKKRK